MRATLACEVYNARERCVCRCLIFSTQTNNEIWFLIWNTLVYTMQLL